MGRNGSIARMQSGLHVPMRLSIVAWLCIKVHASRIKVSWIANSSRNSLLNMASVHVHVHVHAYAEHTKLQGVIVIGVGVCWVSLDYLHGVSLTRCIIVRACDNETAGCVRWCAVAALVAGCNTLASSFLLWRCTTLHSLAMSAFCGLPQCSLLLN